MKKILIIFPLFAILSLMISCKKEDLTLNPNAAGEDAIIGPNLLLNRLDNEIYNGGGVMDGYSNSQSEGPWNQVQRWNQYFVSNYSYYWGNNFYNWSNSATNYGMLKYAVLLEKQIKKQGPSNLNANAYLALAKFFKAYSFIWYSQKVGDIPMSQAGSPNNLIPIFDSQHDVYKNSLALLDTANTLMATYIASPSFSIASPLVPNDVYGLTYLQWQKIINTYKIRVLISLSKRAIDNPDLNVPQQFANIINNPTQYPILTSNADNMVYKYSTLNNPYPIKANGNTPYSQFSNISNTYLNLTTSNADPRTFIAATPAPVLVNTIISMSTVKDPTSTTDTITTSVGHGFSTGQSVYLQGVSPSGYNGSVTVNAIPLDKNGKPVSNQFIITLAAPLAKPTTLGSAGTKLVNDFSAYVGSDANIGQSTLLTNSTNGAYSFANFRYYASSDGSTVEGYIVIGYPELCLNIAEGINRGWAPTSAIPSSTWYNSGVNASLAVYGLTNGQGITIGDKAGKALGKTTVDVSTFLSNITYKGDNTAGLQQIIEQKYVAMFQNSGLEAYLNWRRTGFPAFSQGGPGIGTSSNKIPLRWLYANDEAVANTANYNAALANQKITDDVNAVMWLIK